MGRAVELCCYHLNFSLPLFFSKHRAVVYLSSIPTSNYKKRVNRTNHLRHKLLKSLTPKTPTLLISPSPPLLYFNSPFVEEQTHLLFFNHEMADVGGVLNNEFGKHWVLKLGFYLLAILLFQTVCAVWVFGSHDIVAPPEEGKDSIFEEKPTERSNLLSNEDSSPSILLNGNENNFGMEERLSEIQAMAREVREGERSKAKADEEVDGGVIRTGIEREVDNRLLYVQNKLESIVRMPAIPVTERDDLEGKGKRIDPLMIKKKYKFRGPSGSLGDKPKGFTGTKDYGVNKSNNGVLATEDERHVVGKAKMQSNSVMGATQDEQLKAKAGQWWHSLPYVVAVMMGRGDGGEGPTGMFTLKGNHSKDDDNFSPHLVAFEDRGDANNFCCILESFFEDFGDFCAILVPLSVKDLEEEVKTHSKKVVVVKKRQLKLYAGQPLAEVETALRSLVEKA